MSETGRLKAIAVRGLFGAPPTPELLINLDRKAPTVLTGANGTGKSTLLRVVNAASAGDINTLAAAPLSYLRLDFEDMPSFALIREDKSPSFSVSWGSQGSAFESGNSQVPDLPFWALEALEDADSPRAPEDRIERAAYLSGVSVRERHEVMAAIRRVDYRLSSYDTPSWYSEFSERFPVLFVTDQRLVVEQASRNLEDPRRMREQKKSSRLAVEAASAHIADQMRQLDTAYARASLINDRQFPQQVIRAMNRALHVDPQELEDLVAFVDDRRQILRQVGLLEADDTYLPDMRTGEYLNEQVRPVISLFLETTLKKLEVFNELEAKLSSFKRFLDERFAPKSVSISRQGIRFALPSGETIRPGQLSSGEQQMFVLAYEILFRAQAGTLVIVDEPEISLHVRWQSTLIEHLMDMGSASNLQFLLATHSPVLLGSHPNLERPLDEAL